MPAADLLNKQAPDFFLPQVGGGGRMALSNMRGRVVVLNFWSAECPWSRRADLILVYRYAGWEKKNVRIIGVACNPNEPESELKYEAEARHVKYPIVMDYSQDIALAYQVQYTPHFVVIDSRSVIRYIGAIDDANSTQRLPRTFYIDQAVEATVLDKPANPAYTRPFGSNLPRRGMMGLDST
jgi:alkyl hydroperoxide reductase subunit AhpC